MPVSSRARVDFDRLELDKSFVERSKESLDPVAPDLVVADVTVFLFTCLCTSAIKLTSRDCTKISRKLLTR